LKALAKAAATNNPDNMNTSNTIPVPSLTENFQQLSPAMSSPRFEDDLILNNASTSFDFHSVTSSSSCSSPDTLPMKPSASPEFFGGMGSNSGGSLGQNGRMSALEETISDSFFLDMCGVDFINSMGLIHQQQQSQTLNNAVGSTESLLMGGMPSPPHSSTSKDDCSEDLEIRRSPSPSMHSDSDFEAPVLTISSSSSSSSSRSSSKKDSSTSEETPSYPISEILPATPNVLLTQLNPSTHRVIIRPPSDINTKASLTQFSQNPNILANLLSCPFNLTESSSDFIHILSSRGIMLYASPKSSMNLFGIQAGEMVGRNVEKFVHPGDLVSLMRELKGCGLGDKVGLMYRFKTRLTNKNTAEEVVKCEEQEKEEDEDTKNGKKSSAYVWVEVLGHKYEMKNRKRTKCYILSGRIRHIGDVSEDDLFGPIDPSMVPGHNFISHDNNSNNNNNNPQKQHQEGTVDLWATISPEGLILNVDSHSAPLFGVPNQKVHAHTIYDLTDPKSHNAIRKSLSTLKDSTLPLPDRKKQTVNAESKIKISKVGAAFADSSHTTVNTTVHHAPFLISFIPTTEPRQMHMLYMRVTMLSSVAKEVGIMDKPNLHFTSTLTPSTCSTASSAACAESASTSAGGEVGVMMMKPGVFSRVSTDRNSSLQFELNCLKMANDKLLEELQRLNPKPAGGSIASSGKKRRR
jgi:hypothetical protein